MGGSNVFNKIFSSQSRSITGAAIILGAASLLSRVIGLVRDRTFAHLFGAGDVLDAYYAAFRIPDFLFNLLLAGAISVGFVPVFLAVWKKNQTEAWRLTNGLLTLAGLVLGVVSVLMMILARPLVHLITPGFSGDKLTLTIQLTRIMLLSPLILGLSGVVSSVLHSFKNFALFAIAPLLYNVSVIAGALWLVPLLGPAGLAWGVVIGGVLHLGVQLPAMFAQGWRPRLIFAWAGEVRTIIGLVIPRTFSQAAQQINFLIVDRTASTLATGSLAMFYLAHNLYYVPIGLIGQSFAVAAFPALSALAAEQNWIEFKNHFSRTVRQVLFLVLPLLVLFIILRIQIVRVALGSGAFNWEDTEITADTLGLLTLSLAAHCLFLITARALYALQDTWRPFIISTIGVIVTGILSSPLAGQWQLEGLATALSIAIIIQCALLWAVLRRRLNGLNEKALVTALAKMSAGLAVGAFAAQSLKTPVAAMVDMTRLWGILSQGAICGTVGVLTYGLVCHWLKLEEMALFKQSLTRRWLQWRGTPEPEKL